jgi:hypothetical protein
MYARLLLRTLLMVALSTAPALSQQSQLKPGWKMLMCPFPAGLILKDYESTRKLPEGVRAVKGAVSQASQLDIRGWLKSTTGVELPAEGMAILQRDPTFVVVVAPAAQADLLEPLFDVWNPKEPAHARIVATLAEFENNPRASISELPYQQMRPLAGPSWKELEEITATTKTSERTVARLRSGDPRPLQDPAASARLVPGEEGTAVQLEPVVQPDLETISLNYSWQRRLGQGEKADQLDSSSNIVLKDGLPVVAARWPSADSKPAKGALVPTKCRVLVLRADIVNATGVPIREVFQKAASELREGRGKSTTTP